MGGSGVLGVVGGGEEGEKVSPLWDGLLPPKHLGSGYSHPALAMVLMPCSGPWPCVAVCLHHRHPELFQPPRWRAGNR